MTKLIKTTSIALLLTTASAQATPMSLDNLWQSLSFGGPIVPQEICNRYPHDCPAVAAKQV